MQKKIFIILTIILLAGCNKLRPYRVDVQQGNIIDQHAISKIHIGLTKNEVNSILGPPLLTDIFDPNTWSYVYTNQVAGEKIEKKKLILEFKGKKLAKIAQ
jgi:outer membrane protein assembly factor BamE